MGRLEHTSIAHLLYSAHPNPKNTGGNMGGNVFAHDPAMRAAIMS